MYQNINDEGNFPTDLRLIAEFIYHYPNGIKFYWFEQYVTEYVVGKSPIEALIIFQNSLKVAKKYIESKADPELTELFHKSNLAEVDDKDAVDTVSKYLKLKKINYKSETYKYSSKAAAARNSTTVQELLDYSLPVGYQPQLLVEDVDVDTISQPSNSAEHSNESDTRSEYDEFSDDNDENTQSDTVSDRLPSDSSLTFDKFGRPDSQSDNLSPDLMAKNNESPVINHDKKADVDTMSQASETYIQSPSDACEQSPLQIDEKFCLAIIKAMSREVIHSKRPSADLVASSLSRGILEDSKSSAEPNVVVVNTPIRIIPHNR